VLRRTSLPWNIMIHGLCKDRRTKETTQLHRDMVVAVVETNTTLVNGYCQAGDVGEAIRLQGAHGDVGFCIKWTRKHTSKFGPKISRM
jgi:pentatricopeptide repeat protein